MHESVIFFALVRYFLVGEKQFPNTYEQEDLLTNWSSGKYWIIRNLSRTFILSIEQQRMSQHFAAKLTHIHADVVVLYF